MMKRSVRGMAKVSVVWMIVMVVAFLAAIVMFFVNNGELDNQIKLRESAETARKAAEDSRGQAVKDLVELSSKIGYYNDQAKALIESDMRPTATISAQTSTRQAVNHGCTCTFT